MGILNQVTMLTQEEIDQCREAFERFDKDGSGTIDVWELKATLNAMGQYPTDEELLQMIAEVDDDGSNEIEFSEFLKVIENQKKRDARADDDSDTVLAYVALGGNADKTGGFELVETVRDHSQDRLHNQQSYLGCLLNHGPGWTSR